MSNKIVFAFRNYPELFYYDNTFWLNQKPCKKVYNSGTIQIRKGKFSVGLKKLRTLSYKSQIEINECPF